MENIYYIKNVLVLLSAAIMIVTCFKALKLSPVLGYFVAGAALGKHGASLIAPGTGMELFAELGIVFLLFVIGLELTIKRLMAMKDYILAGIVQIIVTFIIFILFFYFTGYGPNPAAVIAGGLSLSSTAIVLQVLRENGMQATKVGRLSVAMLLIQDFVVVPMLVLVPYLTNVMPESSLASVVTTALLKAAVGLAVVFLVGRLLFRPIFNIIAYFESDELFIATTLLIVLGSAYATEKLGLSMALGAFVSGLVVAETTYRHEVEQVVVPFKALLLGLFFMTIGMSLDVWTLLLMLPKISVVVLSIVLIKLLVIFFIARIFGCNNKEALHTGLLLSQGGEFAFILFKLSFRQGLLDSQTAQVLMISATITMAITPLLDFIGGKINSISEEDEDISNLTKDEFETDGHVVIIGANTTSMALADILIEEGVNCAILDINPDVVIKHKKDGYPIYYGNVTDTAALKKINVENAMATVIAIKNEITAKKAVNAVKQFAPKTKIVIRSRSLKELEEYKKLDVYFLMPPQHEEALTLSSLILKIYGYTETSIDSVRKNFEIQDYASQDELY